MSAKRRILILGILSSSVFSHGASAQDSLRRAELQALLRSCQLQTAASLGTPTLSVKEIRASVGMYRGLYRVRGTVEGVCISDAGVYVNGKRTQSIRVSTSRRFSRMTFEVRVKSNDKVEVRASNTAGETVQLPLELPKAEELPQGTNQTSHFGDELERSPFDRPNDEWDVR